MPNNPLRFVVAGAVSSTRRTLQGLIRHGCEVAGVLELSADAARHVSGYVGLSDIAQDAGVPCRQFSKINAPSTVDVLRAWQPDLLFVVGLSQIVKREVLSIPSLGSVGFHPTALPQGRGRAPIAWLALDGTPGAATFFLIDEGVDSGPILAQETFTVARHAYAADAINEMKAAIDRALDRWLPTLLAGQWHPQPQDNDRATFNGRRCPEDGLIDWNQPASDILSLIRATSRPHPGAYTYYQGRQLVVWQAELATDCRFRGVPGRILEVDALQGLLVQTGDGLLRLTETDGETAPLRAGAKLGFVVEDEVFYLRKRVSELEHRLGQLESSLLAVQGV